MRSRILLPIRMNAAETSASSAIADCTPLAVVSRSCTTAEIDTFISDVSTTSTNIAIARRTASRWSPLDSSAGTGTASVVSGDPLASPCPDSAAPGGRRRALSGRRRPLRRAPARDLGDHLVLHGVELTEGDPVAGHELTKPLEQVESPSRTATIE